MIKAQMEVKNLPGPIEIIKSSLSIFIEKQNLLYLLKIVLLNFGVTLVLILPIMFISGLFSQEPPIQTIGPATTIFIPTIVLIAAVVIWGFLMQATLVVAVSGVVDGKIIGVKDTVRIAWGKLKRYFLTNLLAGLIIFVGFIFLIIPGIIFMVWYSFSQYIVINQDVGPIEALKQSKRLVSGYFWPVVGRLLGLTLFFIIVQIVLGLIPIVGPLVVAALAPYYVLAPYLLFDSLRKLKGKASA
jgi:hypothetical protein